jgi:hypothetical protein
MSDTTENEDSIDTPETVISSIRSGEYDGHLQEMAATIQHRRDHIAYVRGHALVPEHVQRDYTTERFYEELRFPVIATPKFDGSAFQGKDLPAK